MKTILLLLFSLGFIIQPLMAKKLCFYKTCQRSTDADLFCTPVNRTTPFFEFNGEDVNITADTMDNGATRNRFVGCIDARSRIRIGRNNVLYDVIWGSGKSITQGWLSQQTWVELAGQQYPVCEFTLRPGSHDGLPITCEEGVDFDLRELDPQLHQEVQTANSRINELVSQLDNFDADLRDQIQNADDAFNTIENLPFDRLTEGQLAAVQEALDLYRALRTSLDDLRQNVANLRQEFDDRVVELTEAIDVIIDIEGIGKDDFNYLPVLTLQPIEIPALVADYLYDETFDFYTAYADYALNQLQGLYIAEDYTAFIREVDAWLVSSQQLSDHLRRQTIQSDKEWAVFTTQFKRVDHYVFGGSGQAGVLDRDLWFKDSPVSQSIRGFLTHNPFSDSGTVTQALRQELRTWRAHEMNPAQRNYLIALDAMLAGFVEMQAAGAGNDPAIPRLLNHAAAGASWAKNALDASKCLGLSLAAGDFGDLYELVIGVSLCDGQALSTSERVFSGLGLVVASGAFWRGAANYVGLLGDAKAAARLTAELKDLAYRFRIPEIELNALTRDLTLALCGRGMQLRTTCTLPDIADHLKRLLQNAELNALSLTDLKKAVKDGILLSGEMKAWKLSEEYARHRYTIYKTNKQENGLNPLDWPEWFNVYAANQGRVKKATKIVKDFHRQIGGWGRIELSIDLPRGQIALPKSGEMVEFEKLKRRLDIGERQGRKGRGYEVKSGHPRLSSEVIAQITADEYFKHSEGWDIIWYFDGPPSLNLVKRLEKAKIPMEFRFPSFDPRLD